MKKSSKEIIETIVDVINPFFINNEFSLRNKRFFELDVDGGYKYQYEIVTSKNKGYFSLSLRLNLLNKSLMCPVNNVLEKTLKDERYKHPPNWSDKDIEDSIKSRLSNSTVASLSDWRRFKDDNEPLDEFRKRFSIWMCIFDELDEVVNWRDQVIKSANYSLNWFSSVSNEDWIIENTFYPSLVILKMKDDDRILSKYKDVFLKSRDKQEVELFFEHLVS
ncbi:hypothetical protein [Pectobacterium parmentieri]|uniref:hypothetical protein n=1 Tax=Pectobacterium parmentieri TaxID=1905730 RepID=UPI000CDDF35F|nr:hypothetical protein [Pectobacterium parmentieri]AYH07701.1 hypothetical protein C5E25_21280 [Pectobacterium parmentieri]AYH16453.1 hypothetical protein C5E23_20880 [Pectobacterium parmentieri]AYH25154.1 hypothetical protein C5E21_20910 [Pectobacterium parmentieri]MBN3177278.1 hypothetical protein [Pectobacterium parmentieri]POW23729.1 hypothetical protein PB20LOC_04331 [Pectobacterium parmentieri]